LLICSSSESLSNIQVNALRLVERDPSLNRWDYRVVEIGSANTWQRNRAQLQTKKIDIFEWISSDISVRRVPPPANPIGSLWT
jgi:pyruvate carboxylase